MRQEFSLVTRGGAVAVRVQVGGRSSSSRSRRGPVSKLADLVPLGDGCRYEVSIPTVKIEEGTEAYKRCCRDEQEPTTARGTGLIGGLKVGAA